MVGDVEVTMDRVMDVSNRLWSKTVPLKKQNCQEKVKVVYYSGPVNDLPAYV